VDYHPAGFFYPGLPFCHNSENYDCPLFPMTMTLFHNRTLLNAVAQTLSL
jgi:hypothetical protein